MIHLEMNTVVDNLYSRCRKLRIQVITARDNSPLPPLVEGDILLLVLQNYFFSANNSAPTIALNDERITELYSSYSRDDIHNTTC
jgi:hypothetical protein